MHRHYTTRGLASNARSPGARETCTQCRYEHKREQNGKNARARRRERTKVGKKHERSHDRGDDRGAQHRRRRNVLDERRLRPFVWVEQIGEHLHSRIEKLGAQHEADDRGEERELTWAKTGPRGREECDRRDDEVGPEMTLGPPRVANSPERRRDRLGKGAGRQAPGSHLPTGGLAPENLLQ